MSTEVNRILLLIGLFVTGYMLVLAWERDAVAAMDAAAVAAASPLGDEPASATGGVPKMSGPDTDALDVPDVVIDVGGAGAVAPPPQTGVGAEGEGLTLIEVQTDLYHILINPTGGDIVQADLKAYPVSLRSHSQPIRLLSQSADRLYIAQSGLRSAQGPDTRSERAVYSSRHTWVMPEGAEQLEVPLVWRSKDGVEVRKIFRFNRGSHQVEVLFDVANRSASPWQGNLFAQIKHDGRPAPSTQSSLGPKSYEGAAFTTPDDNYLKLDFEDLAETTFQAKTENGWVALLQHYFLSAWVPPAEETYNYYGLKVGQAYHVGLIGPNLSLVTGATGRYSALLYMGPKIQSDLAALAPHLDLAVDYGFLWWLAQPLFWLLEQVYSFTANWGLAIIGLTFVVKLILYPLSAMAYHSMANMRKLAPEMKRLQERHRNDRQKLSQEMMGFYRKEKINPLGGCFPILLQMPVFLALYWVLYESVELRQAPFMLWIDDLSIKDPYFVLPLLMGITMYTQQFLNPPIPDPIQARVIRMMPIVFTLFFLFFPSGLVLYWFTNNILSMAQQYWVNYQHQA